MFGRWAKSAGVSRHGATGPHPRASGATPPAPAPRPRGAMGALKWVLWMLVGIAVTAAAGYLVAALALFPAPLLPNERPVARVGGMHEDEATRELQRRDLALALAGQEPHPRLAVGTVIWQDPPAGVAVPRGTAVTVVLSSGPPRVAVPDVRGYDTEFAKRLMAAAGLRVDGVDSMLVKGVPSGLAAGSEPPAGDSVLIGRSVLLHVAP